MQDSNHATGPAKEINNLLFTYSDAEKEAIDKWEETQSDATVTFTRKFPTNRLFRLKTTDEMVVPTGRWLDNYHVSVLSIPNPGKLRPLNILNIESVSPESLVECEIPENVTFNRMNKLFFKNPPIKHRRSIVNSPPRVITGIACGPNNEWNDYVVNWSDGETERLSATKSDDLKRYISNADGYSKESAMAVASKELSRRLTEAKRGARKERKEKAAILRRRSDTMPAIQSREKYADLHQKLLLTMLDTVEVGRDGNVNCDLGFVIVTKLPIGKNNWLLSDSVTNFSKVLKRTASGIIDEVIERYYSFY